MKYPNPNQPTYPAHLEPPLTFEEYDHGMEATFQYRLELDDSEAAYRYAGYIEAASAQAYPDMDERYATIWQFIDEHEELESMFTWAGNIMLMAMQHGGRPEDGNHQNVPFEVSAVPTPPPLTIDELRMGWISTRAWFAESKATQILDMDCADDVIHALSDATRILYGLRQDYPILLDYLKTTEDGILYQEPI